VKDIGKAPFENKSLVRRDIPGRAGAKAFGDTILNCVAAALQNLYDGGRITWFIDQKAVIRFPHKGMPDNDMLLCEISILQSF
jgi:hypothetical protein